LLGGWTAGLGDACQPRSIQQQLQNIHPPVNVALHQVTVFQKRRNHAQNLPGLFSFLGVSLET